MARPQSVWDFSTPSMDQIGLSECETDDFHRALHLFELTSAPSLLDDDAENGSMHEPPRGSTEDDSPSELQRGRRSVSLEQKQANNREHQRKFRARSKVLVCAGQQLNLQASHCLGKLSRLDQDQQPAWYQSEWFISLTCSHRHARKQLRRNLPKRNQS